MVNHNGEETFKEKNQIKDCYNYDDSPQTKQSSVTIGLILAATTGILTSAYPAGYNLGVVNTPQTILKEFCNETLAQKGVVLSEHNLELLWSFVVSILLIGSVIGAGCGGWCADHFGRKYAILLNSIMGLIASALFGVTKLSNHIAVMLIGRFVAGIHCGISSSLIPLYLTEISPKAYKGAMGVLQVLGLCLGILTAQILGKKELLGTKELWPILLSLNGTFIILGLITWFVIPESPVYLYVLKGKEETAIKVLSKLRKLSVTDLENDITEMKNEQKLQESKDVSFIKLITLKENRLPTFLVCALHGGQQLIGINAVFYYSTIIFEGVGLSTEQSQYGSIGAAAVNTLMSLIAIPLINRFRRRSLLMISTTGATSCLVILFFSIRFQNISWMSYITIGALMCFVAIYGAGIGPIPYMIGSELFKQKYRSSGMSLGCLTNWLTNFIIAMTFPHLQNALHEYVFLIFCGFGILVAIVVYYKLPETKCTNQ